VVRHVVTVVAIGGDHKPTVTLVIPWDGVATLVEVFLDLGHVPVGYPGVELGVTIVVVGTGE
jgi:hypothetical protein